MRMVEEVQHRASDRKFRLLGCGCCRSLEEPLTDQRSLRALEIAERHADGLATLDEFLVKEGVVQATIHWFDDTTDAAMWLTSPEAFAAGYCALWVYLKPE